jgi:NAD-dependent SIR2 family protein deacetylase
LDKANTNGFVSLKLNKNACQDCHHDAHYGQFDSQNDTDSDDVHTILCDKCHTTLKWNATIFDHNRDSNFKLEGAHKKLNCSQCHKTVDKNGTIFVHYKPLDSSCSACHAKRSMGQ